MASLRYRMYYTSLANTKPYSVDTKQFLYCRCQDYAKSGWRSLPSLGPIVPLHLCNRVRFQAG